MYTVLTATMMTKLQAPIILTEGQANTELYQERKILLHTPGVL